MSGRPIPGLGLGVDVHRFGGPGPLLLGGVEVSHDRGLVGHSDGDALCHAVADALLGAAGLGDLGEHFPSDEERWRGASSLLLLGLVGELLGEAGLLPLGIDSTVVCESPRLSPHRSAMAETMAGVLGLERDLVSVKIKSSDGLGLTGRGEGVAALAVARVGELSGGGS